MPDGAANPWGMLLPDQHLIAIAVFGGFVLFGFKLAEHFGRREQDKMPGCGPSSRRHPALNTRAGSA